jgi:hypothetical protein
LLQGRRLRLIQVIEAEHALHDRRRRRGDLGRGGVGISHAAAWQPVVDKAAAKGVLKLSGRRRLVVVASGGGQPLEYNDLGQE